MKDKHKDIFFEILETMAIKHCEYIWKTLHEISMHSGIMTYIIDVYINLQLGYRTLFSFLFRATG